MPEPVNGLKRKILLALRAALNGLLALAFFGLALFVPAQTLDFPNAWLFLGIFVISYVAILVYISFANPDYATTRYRANEIEKAQRIAMAGLISAALGILVVAGFDFRLHWSHVPLAVTVLSAVIMFVCFILLFLVMNQNSYASRVVEIQKEQKLIDTGAYDIVRHPMYLLFGIVFIVLPLVLGSYFALFPAALIPFMLTVRIRNEEKVLMEGLSGYREYMKKVRYRLIPFIW